MDSGIRTHSSCVEYGFIPLVWNMDPFLLCGIWTHSSCVECGFIPLVRAEPSLMNGKNLSAQFASNTWDSSLGLTTKPNSIADWIIIALCWNLWLLKINKQMKLISARRTSHEHNHHPSRYMPDGRYHKRLRSLLLCLWDVFRALIISLLCWLWIFSKSRSFGTGYRNSIRK